MNPGRVSVAAPVPSPAAHGTKRSGRFYARLPFLFLPVIAATLRADAPSLDAIYPAGAPRGTTNLVYFSGKFDLWPPRIWLSAPGLTFSPQTNTGKLFVTVASDAEPGPRLIRCYNEEGITEPRLFLVGNGREISDVETNDNFRNAQQIPDLPVTINGRLDKTGDVDSFILTVRAGQHLDVRVESHTLMSKLDAVLRLVDTNGLQLAWNHDFATIDPRLRWRARADESVVLQIFGFRFPPDSEIRLFGGETAFYRLHLATHDSWPAESAPPEYRTSSFGLTERVQLPMKITGNIAAAQEEHRFRFDLKKNDYIEAKVQAASLGSPLDAWLRIEDENGKELARNNNAEHPRDPVVEWKATNSGSYVLALGSLTHRGGDEFRYRLTMQQAKPDFVSSLAVSSLTVTPGSTNTVKINLKRLRGHTNELQASISGLPEWVIAAITNAPKKGSEIAMQIVADERASAFQGSVQVFLRDLVTGEERLVHFPLTRTDENSVEGYAHLLIDQVDDLWLTVRPKTVGIKKQEK